MENMNSILNQYFHFHFHFHFGNCFRSGECIIYPAVAHNSCYRLCKSCSNHFLWGYVKLSAALLGKIKLRFNVWNTFATRRTHTQMLRCFCFIFFFTFPCFVCDVWVECEKILLSVFAKRLSSYIFKTYTI